MNKRTIFLAATSIAGTMLVGLFVAAVSLAAPLVPDTDLSQADASFWGEDAGDQSGYSVAGTGDVNGDGYDDFLIGAPYDAGADASQTYLVLGQGSGWAMDTDLSLADASFLGENLGDQSGCSVAGAGDVNGDGYRDFLIGARRYDASVTVTYTGKTYLVLGQASGWAMDTGLSLADASFLGESAGDQSGHSVAGAGDVDGDGYDDFLIGAPYNDGVGADAGQTYLILGRPTVSWTVGMSLTVDADASFLGENGGDQSGYSVAGAGDVNGDSYDDLLVGAPRNDGGGADAGQTYLILGRPTIDWTVGMSLTVDADASFLGEDGDDWAGYSVAGAGDVNGDGYDDFLIGAWRNDQNGTNANAGQTYLILGRAAADWGMDVDLSNANASFWGEVGSDWSGWSVSGAGDVNGDGYDDFVIGAYGNDDGGDIAGQTYLILGRAAADWGMNFRLSNADASFWGEDEFDNAGYSVSGAGDVNNDGYDDFLIGAQNNIEGGSQAGQTYLVFGNGLSLSKIARSDPITAGEVFTYTISYANTMYVNATGVVITDSVPANTTYIDCDGGQSCSESDGVVTWNIGDVISQTSGVVTLTLQVDSALCEDTIITNIAHISATNIYNSLAATVTNTVIVTPTASFTSSTPVCLGTPMLFTDTSQCAAAWLWDFGDGIGTSNAQDPSYTYTGAGDYTVTLTATNTSGHSNSHQAAVTVRPLPQASFTAATPVCLGQVMTFTNTSTGATSYQWNFGDGQGSTAENPTHDYGAVGSYTVVLTATNAAGCFDVYSDTVTVASALDHIVVSPSSVTLAPGETQLFTATGYDQYGNEVSGLTFTWEVVNGGGIIDSSGVFTAGTTAGQYTDTVRATANGVSGYASVTVSASQTTLFLPIILKMFP